MNKTCPQCPTLRSDRHKFSPCKKSKDGLKSWCKDCSRGLVKKAYSYEKYKEKYSSSNARAGTLKKYGLTLETYDLILQKQRGVCSICNSPESAMAGRSLAVDHSHVSGEVRGLLCTKCNTALGMFKDDITIIRNALAYLTGEITFLSLNTIPSPPDYHRVFANSLKHRYGISVLQYQTMLVEQNFTCAICTQPETRKHKGVSTRLGVDHNHSTGLVRGLLCFSCNAALGHFNDDINLLSDAIRYLRGGLS